MLLVLSPAKTLDYESPLPTRRATEPLFVPQAALLAARLRELTTPDLMKLMDLSEKLAELNVDRFRRWEPHFHEGNSRQAALAFDGDVYEGLAARELSEDDLLWAQDRLAILSGLYGVLRPLDRMQPYRLEMGTRISIGHHKDLYAFWGVRLAEWLDQQVRTHTDPVIVNLASEEYFKAASRKNIQSEVIDCVFEDWKSGQWKVISFNAKRARGLMARHIITRRLEQRDGLASFSAEQWRYAPEASEPHRFVFRRKLED